MAGREGDDFAALMKMKPVVGCPMEEYPVAAAAEVFDPLAGDPQSAGKWRPLRRRFNRLFDQANFHCS
jgi:hypothetical protein